MQGVTYRPIGPRIIAWVCTVLLIVMAVVIGRALPENMKFRPGETATIAVLLLCVAVGAHAIGRSHVTIDQHGMTVVNGFKRREVDWSQVTVVSMKPGAPWPTVVTIDDERFALFAIQGSDKGQTRRALAQIRQHWHQGGTGFNTG